MADESARVAAALTEAAQMMHAPSTLDETLDAIVQATLRTIPGFDHVGISITHRSGKIETRAGTDELVWHLDDLQYRLGEGPSYDSVSDSTITVLENARHDQRWPNYLPQAVRRGLRAQLSVGLSHSDAKTVAGLNLYSTASETVDPDAIHVAELFAAHAAIALGRSCQVTQLHDAISSRKVIGQAIGILMERYRIDEERAFQFLVRASQTGNIKLRAVAEELVSTTSERFTTS